MRYNIYIKNSSFGACDGADEISGNELIFYKKSQFVRAFFGAVGVAIASGKEALRFSVGNIQSYAVTDKTFSRLLEIKLNDGNYVCFKLKSDVESEIMPLLENSAAHR